MLKVFRCATLSYCYYVLFFLFIYDTSLAQKYLSNNGAPIGYDSALLWHNYALPYVWAELVNKADGSPSDDIDNEVQKKLEEAHKTPVPQKTCRKVSTFDFPPLPIKAITNSKDLGIQLIAIGKHLRDKIRSTIVELDAPENYINDRVTITYICNSDSQPSATKRHLTIPSPPDSFECKFGIRNMWKYTKAKFLQVLPSVDVNGFLLSKSVLRYSSLSGVDSRQLPFGAPYAGNILGYILLDSAKRAHTS